MSLSYLLPANFTLSVEPTVLATPKPDLIESIPDGILALIAPIVAYWLMSSFFYVVDCTDIWAKYRIHESEEVKSRNKATISDVLKDVIIQHVVQSVVGYGFYLQDPKPTTGHEFHVMWRMKTAMPVAVPDAVIYLAYAYALPAAKLLGAIVIIDTWQYWLHRTMHDYKFLYRHFHSRHHRLYVPYAFGALYNNPVEGFLLDTLGTGIAAIAMRLAPRETCALYTFATLKTVNDHCGYALPWDVFRMVFPNNSVYHDIHHQMWGIKHNFSQPFFCFWDKFTNTDYKLVKGDSVSVEEYKDFLVNKRYKAKKEN
ncbi:hypothetical protein BABINDRAFT_160441 [Babjeviella inositovora NRRL Y-12698]|uniref:Fatty acid hydroxylase domain-containing protein n=1 Tax=Babjeviella inositovora NRRL Y-12698 TaxID=984486 RepID=A0A1E3QVC5_9ASCO|nr:uncharacterized protein BABINDRAFT_160441 [Babjeviella inositovora NRRL Y-12698]ODQ81022.1 hypothetical protein BABINDRAFT_160441 [Babjeviella inositovora NRRL Y-12698]